MNYLKKMSIFCLATLAGALSASALAFEPAQQPLCLVGSNKPMTMLIMGRDHTLYYEAYNDATNLDDDPEIETIFKPAIKYYGYFDPTYCYKYDNNKFKPDGSQDGNGVCSSKDKWHGNFLNYLTMSRIDVLRKVLYGGKRSRDDTETDLIRANIPRDAHTWAKQYPAEGKTPSEMGFKIKDYAAVNNDIEDGDNKHHLFANVYTQLWIRENVKSSDPKSTAREWASQERKGSGDGILSATYHPSYDDYKKPPGVTVRDVKIKACTKAGIDCQAYGAYHKPVGILQTVGVENQMQFGLMTGTYHKNLSGGVLRKRMSTLDDEIGEDGRFTKPSGDGGNIIDNIDNFKVQKFYKGSWIYSETEYECGWVRHEPLKSGGMKNGRCKDWGNPIGEMMYESVRYFQGKKDPTEAFHWPEEYGLSSVDWDDPFKDGTKFDSCALPYNLVISDLYPSYDGDGVPSAIMAELDDMKADEGINGTKSFFVGENLSGSASQDDKDTEYNPTAKKISSLKDVRGLGPFNAAEKGSYSSAAVAKWARTTDIRTSVGETGDQIVKTLVVALSSPLPEFNFQFGSQTVSVIPFGKSPVTAYNSGQRNDPRKGHYQPTNSVLDFYVLDKGSDGELKEVMVSFDDVTQGGDHDLDATVKYTFTANKAAKTLKIKTEVKHSGADATTQHLGYIISGTKQLFGTSDTTCDEEPDVPESLPIDVSTDVGNSEGNPEVRTEWKVWLSYDHWTCNGCNKQGPFTMYYDEWAKEFYIDRNVVGRGVANNTGMKFESSNGEKYPSSGDWMGPASSGTTSCIYFKDKKDNSGSYHYDNAGRSCAWGPDGDNKYRVDEAATTNNNYGQLGGSDLAVNDYVFQDIRDLDDIVSYKMERNNNDGTLVSALIPDNLADGEFRVNRVVLKGSSDKEIKPVLSGNENLVSGEDQRGDMASYYQYSFKTHDICDPVCIFDPADDNAPLTNASARMYIHTSDVATEASVALNYPSSRVSDGIYLEVTDQGFGPNHSPTVGYYLDTLPGEYPYPANRKADKCAYYQGGRLPDETERTFLIDSATSKVASVLKSPLWYAAKWGGFKDIDKTGNIINEVDTGELATGTDTDPDNFWLVTNASTLPEQLKAAFTSIIDDARTSQTSFAVSSGSIKDDSLIFSASYESATWSGDIQSYAITQSSNNVEIKGQGMWSARAKMRAQFPDDAAIDGRIILTMNAAGAGELFTADAKKEEIKAMTGTESSAIDLINYVRGYKVKETDGTFRKRNAENPVTKLPERFVLGDIINSSPEMSTKPSLYLSDPSYKEFYANFKDRTEVIVVGANDGMVHVIDSGKNSSNTGKELFAYIPRQMYREDNSDTYLSYLSEVGFQHKYYVDGPIQISDAKGGDDVWRTIAIGSFGGGGKGYYALDITDPDPTSNDKLEDENNRFNGSTTTPVLWERPEFGHVYGKAVVGKLNNGSKQWVALLANGYGDDATRSTTPQLTIVDAVTGKNITGTAVIDTSTDSSLCVKSGGLSALTAVSEEGTLAYAYAGDLNGNLWKFDLRNPSELKVECLFTASYTDSDSNVTTQPITAAPSIGFAPAGLDGYVVYFGTGKFNEGKDSGNVDKQAFYAVFDKHTTGGTELVTLTKLAELKSTGTGIDRVISVKDSAVIDFSAKTGYNRGYYLVLPKESERMVTPSNIFLNKVNFASVMPTGGESCETGCLGFSMELNLYSGVGEGHLQKNAQPKRPVLGKHGIFAPIPPYCADADCKEQKKQEADLAPDSDSVSDDCEGVSVTNDTDDVEGSDTLGTEDAVILEFIGCKGDGRKSWRHVY